MILVTGSTGTVGSLVVEALLEEGAAFRAAVHARPLDVGGVETCTIDYDRPETLPPALEGVRVVFLASYATVHEQAMVEAALSAGVERIVKLSAWRAADEGFAIGRWHREVEQAIEASGLAWTFLRPNFFMQNFVSYVGEGIREERAIYEPGDARVSYIDARDIAHAAARVLTTGGHEGRAYDLSGPEALTHEQIAALLTGALGRPVRHVPTSVEGYRHKLLGWGFPEGDAVAFADAYRYGRAGALSTVTTAVAGLTGRAPIPFAQFCRDHAPAPHRRGVDHRLTGGATMELPTTSSSATTAAEGSSTRSSTRYGRKGRTPAGSRRRTSPRSTSSTPATSSPSGTSTRSTCPSTTAPSTWSGPTMRR